MKRIAAIISILLLCANVYSQTFDFEADNVAGCAPLKVIFLNKTAEADKNNYTYDWVVEQGKYSTQADSIQNTYLNSGKYSVTMRAYDVNKKLVSTVTKKDYITVYNDPDVTIKSDKASTCQDKSFQFSIESLKADTAIRTYTWILSDGSVYNGEIPPAHTFGFADDFTVFLSVTDEHGCSNRERKSITVKTYDDYPQLSFQPSKSRVCDSKLDVTFTNTTEDANVVSYQWNFGDGQTYAGKTPPMHRYTGFGTYYAVLSAVSAHECETRTSRSIQLIDFQPSIGIDDGNPAIDFASSASYSKLIRETPEKRYPFSTIGTDKEKTSFCPGTFTFRDNSMSNASCSWDFNNDGTIDSYSNEFTVDITTGGTYTIKLTASNGTCTKDVIRTFVVEDPLDVVALPTEDFYCAVPANVSYSATSNVAGTKFMWVLDAADNLSLKQDSFTYMYDREGCYSAFLYALTPSYCTAEKHLEDNVEITRPSLSPVKPQPHAIYPHPRSGCVPLTVNFISSYTYNTDRDHVKSISWDYQDDGTIDETVSLADEPNSGQIAQPYVYTAEGTYKYVITLETEKGCKVRNRPVEMQEIVSVGDIPDASFSFPSEICANADLPITVDLKGDKARYSSLFDSVRVVFAGPDKVFHEYSSYGSPVSPVKNFVHNFGDGNDSIGVHYATFTLSDNGCHKDFKLDEVVLVKGPMTYVKQSDPSCEMPYIYTYGFEKNYGSTSWKWFLKKVGETDAVEIADGEDSVVVDFSNYGGRGSYKVWAEAVNDATGCSMSDTTYTTVTDLKGDFELKTYEPCLYDELKFALSTETAKENDIASWTWVYDFNGENKSFTFARYDRYRNELDYEMVRDTTPRYFFKDTAIDHVTVLVTDIHDCTQKVEKAVKVVKPYAGFVGDVVSDCLPFTTNFSDTSKSEYPIVERIWYLGNGEVKTGNDSTVTTEYATRGNKYVSLAITDSHGCRDTASISDYIKPVVPNAQFSVEHDKLCLGHEASFVRSLNSPMYYDKLTKYIWDFGDGMVEEKEGDAPKKTTYVYQTPTGYNKTFNVRLTAYCQSPEDHECMDSSSQQIDVKDVGSKITVRESDKCKEPGQKFVVYLSTMASSSNIDRFDWWKIEGNDSIYIGSKRQLQVVTFDTYGTHRLYLRTQSKYFGCEDTTSFTEFIVPGYEVEMYAEKTESCVHEDISFFLKDTLNLSQYNTYWEFGDGATAPLDGLSTTHAYEALAATEDNSYKVQFVVDAPGCKPRDIFANITLYPVMADFDRGTNDLDTIGCAPKEITLYNKSVAGKDATYLWTFGNGKTSTEQTPTVHLTEIDASLPISLTVNSSICNDTKTKLIHTYPVASVAVDMDSVVCLSETISAQANGDFVAIQWEPQKYFTNPNAVVTKIDLPKTQYVYLTSTNQYGCKTTDSVFVYVQQKPHYFGAPDSVLLYYGTDNALHLASRITNELIVGQTYNLNATAVDGVSYLWSPDDYLSCADCPSPDLNLECPGSFEDCLSFPDFINYRISMSDSLGCFTSDTTIHFNLVLDTKIGLPEAFTPNGDGVNDIAYVRGWGIREFVEVKIYNRWGQVVFESDDMSVGWDGTYKGEPQSMDTFAYTIKAIDVRGDDVFVKGYITLIR